MKTDWHALACAAGASDSSHEAPGPAPALTNDQRSYLAQAMDIAAGLDIGFGELADAFADPTSHF